MNSIEKAAAFDIERVKNYLRSMNLASNLTQAEVTQFIEIAQGFGLNPFKREIYASKYGNNFSVIVGYETYIKRAERSGRLSGWNVTTDGKLDDGSLKAIITIHRNDFTHPFVHEVFYSEYVQRTKEGRPTKFWADKPYTMIKKVAMAQGFRLCFSDELGGMPYTADELPDQVGQNQIVIEPKEEKIPLMVSNQEVYDKILVCVEMDCLADIWKSNPDLHTNDEFKKLVTDRKSVIAEFDRYDNMIEKINACKTEDEVYELLENETNKELLEAGENKVQILNNQNQ
jgi:phage recombination protein Bet